MFAFVIWDEKEKAFVARDRFGVKHYIITRKATRLLFASEIKQFTYLPGFKSLLNKEHFSYFLLNKYHPISDTTCLNCYAY